MKSFRIIVGASAIAIWGMIVGAASAQSAPPLRVALTLDKATYSLRNPEDPIQIAITLEKTRDAPLIASAGLLQAPLHLLLTFYGPDKKAVIAQKLEEAEKEGAPPRVFLQGEDLVQVDEVTVFSDRGVVASTFLPNARSFYPLKQCGRYAVTITVPVRTYPASFTIDGDELAELDSSNFAGALVAGPLSFTQTDDADGDSFRCPEDCNDGDLQIHPGAAEVLGNQIDDDCNPATLDTPPPSTIHVETVQGSAMLNNILVKAFDRSDECVKRAPGQKRIRSIWLSCIFRTEGRTGASEPGKLELIVQPQTSYLLIAALDPDGVSNTGDESLKGIPVEQIKAGRTRSKVIRFKDIKPSGNPTKGGPLIPDEEESE